MTPTTHVSDAATNEQIVVAVLVADSAPALPQLPGVEFRCVTAEDLPPALIDADALLVWDFAATGLDRALPTARRLRWMHMSSAGVDRVLMRSIVPDDVLMTNARGVLDDALAEYVLGLLLSLVKDLHGTRDRQSARRWEHRPTRRLAGRRALIVGVGGIGRSIGALLRAVGVDVAGVGRTAREDEPPFGTVYAHTDLPEIVGSYDTIVLAAPLTPETDGILDATTLASMRPESYVINVGRGRLLDQDALTDLLMRRSIAGAALDVFIDEPLPPQHRLWGTANTIISPHMAGDYVGWRDDLLALFLDNLDRFRRGVPLRNTVDKSLGYVTSSCPQPEGTNAP